MHAERLIGTIRRECLNHLIVMGESHAREILEEYVRYYNEERAHQSLDGDAPEHRDQQYGIGRVVGVPLTSSSSIRGASS